MNWKITGDTHGIKGILERVEELNQNDALIILGDAGVNFYLDKREQKNKRLLNKRLVDKSVIVYCVRGNHEERPENLGYPLMYDELVGGEIYIEEEFPNIRYFKDGGIYSINRYRFLVIGGAYSVDKKIRLARAMPGATWTGWFENEQLSEAERELIFANVKDEVFDFVLTHTCPTSYEPIEMFLPMVDQSSVDKTMEDWLEKIKQNITVNHAWFWGHYHGNKMVNEKAFMLYNKVFDLADFIPLHKAYRGM